MLSRFETHHGSVIDGKTDGDVELPYRYRNIA